MITIGFTPTEGESKSSFDFKFDALQHWFPPPPPPPEPKDIHVKLVAFGKKGKETIFEAQDDVTFKEAKSLCYDPIGAVKETDQKVGRKVTRAFVIIDGGKKVEPIVELTKEEVTSDPPGPEVA